MRKRVAIALGAFSLVMTLLPPFWSLATIANALLSLYWLGVYLEERKRGLS